MYVCVVSVCVCVVGGGVCGVGVYLGVYLLILEGEEHKYLAFLFAYKWVDSPLFPEMIETDISEGEFSININLPFHFLCSYHFSS